MSLMAQARLIMLRLAVVGLSSARMAGISSILDEVVAFLSLARLVMKLRFLCLLII